jgi:TctA family transporter
MMVPFAARTAEMNKTITSHLEEILTTTGDVEVAEAVVAFVMIAAVEALRIVAEGTIDEVVAAALTTVAPTVAEAVAALTTVAPTVAEVDLTIESAETGVVAVVATITTTGMAGDLTGVGAMMKTVGLTEMLDHKPAAGLDPVCS